MVAELGCHAYEPFHPPRPRRPAGRAMHGRGRWSDRGGGGRGLGYTVVCARSVAGCLYSRIDFRRIRKKMREESRK